MALSIVSDAPTLLCRIEDVLRILLVDIANGTMPSIIIAKHQLRKYPLQGSEICASVFENSKRQRIGVDRKGAGRRLIRLLRVLQIIQCHLQENRHVSKRGIYYTDPACLGGCCQQGVVHGIAVPL